MVFGFSRLVWSCFSPVLNDTIAQIKDFKIKSNSAFAKSVESSLSSSEQWKEANLQKMTSKELVDHLEGLRNTVKRLQNSECKFKVVDEEEVSCG